MKDNRRKRKAKEIEMGSPPQKKGKEKKNETLCNI